MNIEVLLRQPDDCALRLRDEGGADVAPREIGELWLRGPSPRTPPSYLPPT